MRFKYVIAALIFLLLTTTRSALAQTCIGSVATASYYSGAPESNFSDVVTPSPTGCATWTVVSPVCWVVLTPNTTTNRVGIRVLSNWTTTPGLRQAHITIAGQDVLVRQEAATTAGPVPANCATPDPAVNGTATNTGSATGTLTPTAPPIPTPPTPSGGDVTSVSNTTLEQLRVMVWNAAQGYNKINGSNNYPLQIAFMAQQRPDVIAVAEMSYSDADMMTAYINGLTSRTGQPWHGYYQRQNTDTTPTTGNVGAAILTYLPVDQIRQALNTTTSQPFEMLEIQVTINNVPIHIASTHLYAWDAAVRQPQLASLQAWVSNAPHRMVVGDFNANPTDPTWTNNPTWATTYTDAWMTATNWVQPTNDPGYTFDKRTATGVPERIDYVWTAGMNLYDMALVKTHRSDHHALVATFNIP